MPARVRSRRSRRRTVEQYVANRRKQQATLNEYLDCIEDILSPAAPLQVAWNAAPDGGASEGEGGSEAAPAEGKGAKSAKGSKESGVKESGVKEEVSEGDDDGEAKKLRRESISERLTREITVELGLTTEQVDGLARLQREFVRPDKGVVAECMRLIHQLRGRLKDHIEASQRMTDQMRRILEPSQVPKYLEWVERNQRSMNIYNTIVSAD